MVVTRAQEASTNFAGGHLQPTERPEANPSIVNPPATPAPLQPPPATSVPPNVAAAAIQTEMLTALTHQVQALTAMVHGLQEQQSATTQYHPRPPTLPVKQVSASQQSSREPPLQGGPHHHRSSPRGCCGKAPKRSRSPIHNMDNSSSGRQNEEEPRWKRHHLGASSSLSSSSSGKTSVINRRAERHLDEYHQCLKELSRKINKQSREEYDTRPPFARHILEKPVPPRFRLPQLDPYDGTTDPLDHLESYKALMQVQGATDALLCRTFLATLRKAARAWHSRLAPHSINSFQQLERSFLAHFEACRRIPRVADSLFSIRQKEGENL